MIASRTALLADRSVLRVTGADARKFLQGLITNDVDKVREGVAIFAGLLTPQGKILFEFFVAADGEDLLLDCPVSSAAALEKRLGFYKLRAAVAVTDVSEELAVFACWSREPDWQGASVMFQDPRLPALGYRVFAECSPGFESDVTAADYHAHRISVGAPEAVHDFRLGELFPHEADYDQLNGVDFRKGCFIGQEVVSRMEHRGTARSRLVPVDGDAPLPPAGTAITAGDLPLGAMGSSDGARGLALVRLDRAGDAAAKGIPIRAGDVALTLRHPEWARFPMPRSAA